MEKSMFSVFPRLYPTNKSQFIRLDKIWEKPEP